MKHATDLFYCSALALCAYAYSVKDNDFSTQLSTLNKLAMLEQSAINIELTPMTGADTILHEPTNDAFVSKAYHISFDSKTHEATTTVVSNAKTILGDIVSNYKDTLSVSKSYYGSSRWDKFEYSVDSATAKSNTFKTNYQRYFNSDPRLFKSFCIYIKTQSSVRLGDDNWAVIKTMFNRMDYHECNWQTYWDDVTINNSQSIRKLKAGTLRKTFLTSSKDDTRDEELYARVIETLAGGNPVGVPSNVLFFENCKGGSPNSSVHKMRNLWKRLVHRFYYHVD